MKRILNIALVFLSFVLTLSSCESDTKMPEMIKVSLPLLTQDGTADVLIQNSSFEGKFEVDLYFDDLPEDANLVVARNGDYEDVKVIVAGIKTFPSNQTISYAKLMQLFGLNEIVAGETYEIGLDVKNKGIWFYAFNENGISYSSDLLGLPGSNPVVTYRSVCNLDIDQFTGTATISDGFWTESDYQIQVTKVADNVLEVSGYGDGDFVDPAGKFKITVNPNNHTISVSKQVWAPTAAGFTYTNWSIAAATGSIDACNKVISFTGSFTVDQGSFGTAPIKIKF